MTKLEEKSQNTNRTLLRLEEKLEELGYTEDCQTIYLYFKHTPIGTIYAYLNKNRTKCGLQLDNIEPINNEEELNSLFQSYNIMKKDLEELKNVKD